MYRCCAPPASSQGRRPQAIAGGITWAKSSPAWKTRSGTGGVSYLRKMLGVVLFPEIWKLRTDL
jgi:hypothetical protein